LSPPDTKPGRCAAPGDALHGRARRSPPRSFRNNPSRLRHGPAL
jgi:hypothetical protein